MSFSKKTIYTKLREEKFDEINKKFYQWYQENYHTRPICLYLNLLNLENWDMFYPENEDSLIIYLKNQGYFEYFSKKEIGNCLSVVRKYLYSF